MWNRRQPTKVDFRSAGFSPFGRTRAKARTTILGKSFKTRKMNEASTIPTPRWLHWWAVGTTCATFVLILLGSVVTTFRVGMADPIWPTYPWHLMLISWDEPSPGFIIEHSHRLAGYIVGCCTIVLAIGLAIGDPRKSLKLLGFVALAGVIIQGLLGGFRVVLHAILGTNLALIHGVFAQVVFSLMVVLAVLTSKSWFKKGEPGASATGVRSGATPVADAPGSPKQFSLRRAATLATGCMFIQIVAGATLRHTLSPVSQRLHLMLAFVATAAVVWMLKLIFDSRERILRTPAWLLIGLLAFQVMLGAEVWLKRFADPPHAQTQQVTVSQAAMVTAHVMIGFGLLATTVVITLWAFRFTQKETGATRLTGNLEAAA